MTQDYKKWLGEKIGQSCVTHLINHRFDAHFVNTPQSAVNLILDWVKTHDRFGFGGSATIKSLGIKDILLEMKKKVFDHNEEGLTPEKSLEYRKKQSACDCFLCSANALSQTGEIVNVDGIGNRTNAMCFGPQKVIVVAGINKVMPTLEAAIRRVKDVAAPMRAKSLGVETPCAVTGHCTDCNSPMRICNITAILHRKPMLTDISVIVVNEELGF